LMCCSRKPAGSLKAGSLSNCLDKKYADSFRTTFVVF
jgi:hypothetical protein